MKKVICFNRVSSSRQDLTAQRKAVKEAAIRDKYTEDEIIEVSGKESAIKLDEEQRQTLNEMKSLVEEYPIIESIYFFAVDRLARRMSIVLSVAEWAEKNNINLVFLNPYPIQTMMENEKGQRVKNAMADVILTMMGFAAQMEMNAKNARFSNARDYLRKQNKATGKLLFGYKADKNRDIVIDTEKTAPIVLWVFDSYLKKGMSTTQIYDEGVALGYWADNNKPRNRGGKIRAMLVNKEYCGKPTKLGQIYPILIDEDTIDRAIDQLNKNFSGEKKYLKNIYYCKGKIFDEHTGYSLTVDFNHMKYMSQSLENAYNANLNICDWLCWRVAAFVKWNMLTMDDDTQIEGVKEQITEIGIKITTLKEQIEKDIEPQYSKAYDAFVKSKGRITIDMYEMTINELDREQNKQQKKINELEKRESELANILQQLENKEKRDVSIYDIKDITDDQQRKEIIDEVIEKITIRREDKKKLIISVFYPLYTSPTVFEYIQHGGTKKEIYEIVGDLRMNISEEYKPRFVKAQHKTTKKTDDLEQMASDPLR